MRGWNATARRSGANDNTSRISGAAGAPVGAPLPSDRYWESRGIPTCAPVPAGLSWGRNAGGRCPIGRNALGPNRIQSAVRAGQELPAGNPYHQE